MDEGQFLDAMNSHEVMDNANRAKRDKEKVPRKPKELDPKKIHPNKRRKFSDNHGKKPQYNNKFRDSRQTGNFPKGPMKYCKHCYQHGRVHWNQNSDECFIEHGKSKRFSK